MRTKPLSLLEDAPLDREPPSPSWQRTDPPALEIPSAGCCARADFFSGTEEREQCSQEGKEEGAVNTQRRVHRQTHQTKRKLVRGKKKNKA